MWEKVSFKNQSLKGRLSIITVYYRQRFRLVQMTEDFIQILFEEG